MKIEFLYDRSAISLPGSALSAVGRASAEELRVLLALAVEKNDIDRLSELSGVCADRIPAALRFWSEAGVSQSRYIHSSVSPETGATAAKTSGRE